MGTKVQSKMYLPGYYAPNDHLGNSAGYDVWPLHHKNKSLRNGLHFDMLLAWPVMDGFHVDKEQLRHTILKQDTIFRQQVRELHRVYNIQKELTNEVRGLFSPVFQSKDDKKSWHVSDLLLSGSSCARPSMSGIDVMQSCCNSLKGKVFESSCVSDQHGIKPTDHEYLDFKCKKRQRILIDLERLPDEYINDGKELQGEHGVLKGESFPFNKGNDVIHYSDKDNRGGDSTSYKGHDLTNGLHLERTSKLADLNEPIGFEEAYTAAIVINLCDETFPEKEREKSAISENNVCHVLHPGKKLSENVGVNNVHLKENANQTEWSSCTFEAAQFRNEKSSLSGNFHLAFFRKPCESSRIESSRTNEVAVSDTSKANKQMKRTLFGVEISELHDEVITLDSKEHDPQTIFVPQSHMGNYELSSSSSWKKIPSTLKQNLKGADRDIGYDISLPSNEGLSLLPPISQVTGERLHGVYNSRATPSLKSEGFNLNHVCAESQSEFNDLQAGRTPMCLGFSGHISDSCSAEKFAKYDPQGSFSDLQCVAGAVPIKGMNEAAIPNEYHREVICKENVISVDEQRKQESSQEGIFWPSTIQCCKSRTSEEESSGSLKIIFGSTKGNSEQLLNEDVTRKSLLQCNIQDSASATQGQATERKNVGRSDCSSIKKILAFPMDDSSAKTPCLGFVNPIKPGLDKGDLTCDPASTISGERDKVEGPNVGKSFVNDGTAIKHSIDLNTCLTEEEDQLTPASLIVKVDLEAPTLDEIEIGSTQTDYLENKCKEYFDSLENEISLPHERLVRVAAEALVAISSLSDTYDLLDDAAIDLQENGSDSSPSDTLHWLADIISSFQGGIDNEAEVRCSMASDESLIPDDMDYFEYMTLNLTETKGEQYCYMPLHVDNPEEEPNRPRRGQARRGRQRKDFLKDVLPSITSLSRNEVTEDIQIIDGLIRATGGTWQSTFTQRKNGRGGGRRGRRRGGRPAPSPSLSPPVTAIFFRPQIQQTNCKEQGLEETTLGGWGKRTTRPPRPRYPTNNSPVALK